MTPRRLAQTNGDRVQRVEDRLVLRYGPLLTIADVTEVLRYPSVQAVQKARLRGSLPIKMFRMPPRRGWFVSSHTLAVFLAAVELQSAGEGLFEQVRRPRQELMLGGG